MADVDEAINVAPRPCPENEKSPHEACNAVALRFASQDPMIFRIFRKSDTPIVFVFGLRSYDIFILENEAYSCNLLRH